jgi:hypothetical protein
MTPVVMCCFVESPNDGNYEVAYTTELVPPRPRLQQGTNDTMMDHLLLGQLIDPHYGMSCNVTDAYITGWEQMDTEEPRRDATSEWHTIRP